MKAIGRVRFSMGTIMIFVLLAATASALFAEARQHARLIADPEWQVDGPSLLLLAIGLTGVALGAWKAHSASQTMLQIALACLGCLSLIWIGESGSLRAARYWFEAAFAVAVTFPLLGRRYVKAALPRGPRRNWWKKTCEAVFFSFLNLLLVTGGAVLVTVTYALAAEVLTITGAP